MDITQQNRNINQYRKDSIIFEERNQANQIALLVKGRVVMESAGVRDVLLPGSFLGIQDVFAKNHLCTYRALEDTILYTMKIENEAQLYEKITSNPDYCGLAVASMCKQLSTLSGNNEDLYNSALNAYNGIVQYGMLFEKYANSIKIDKNTILKTKAIKEPEKLDVGEELEYYNEISTFTLESIRGYFSQGKIIVCKHIREMAKLYHGLTAINQQLNLYLTSALEILAGNTQDAVFYHYTELAKTFHVRGKEIAPLLQAIEHIIESAKEYKDVIEGTSNKSLYMDFNSMEQVYIQILTGAASEVRPTQKDEMSEGQVLQQCTGALDIILSYAELDLETMSNFKNNMKAFLNLKNRLSIDDSVRTLRHKITADFYHIYEKVFIKAYEDPNQPLAVQFFLKYGFMEETLLEPEQILKLYQISTYTQEGRFKVYSMYDWLLMIYNMEREPSKNEFDLDYPAYLKEELIARRITREEYNEQIDDRNLRLHFEIVNFFQNTNRIANTKITTFLPVLHKDLFYGAIERFWVGAHKIEAALQRVMDVDYSLFYREVGYTNREKKIDKEYIMMEVLPEFILAPTVGSGGVMWQTHSGYEKDTPARIVLPMFMDGNLQDVMLKLCGKFRWEMCRAVQGAVWNSIKYRSLTSEYSDYLQFYRKNRELSDEKKEKIKLQLQKCNNRSADVFVIDYEAWIKGESQGAVRLNKVVRRILAFYCPFEKSIRNRIMVQPLFTEPFQAFELERQKKVREISNHYKALQNKQIEITKEMMDSLNFYQDL